MKTKIYVLLDQSGLIKYVGKTIRSLKHRLSGHIASSKKRNSHKDHWIRQCMKNGYIPEIKLIEEVDGDGCEYEKFYIKIFRKMGFNLTNLTDGGDGTSGYKMSEEHRLRHIAINSDGRHKGKNNIMYGKKHSDETKEKIKQKAIGRKASEETKKKIGSASKGRKYSEESIRKILTARGIKSFVCIQTNKVYRKIKDAAEELDLYGNNICECLKGRRKTSGGYSFKYIDEIDPNDNQQRYGSGYKTKGQ